MKGADLAWCIYNECMSTKSSARIRNAYKSLACHIACLTRLCPYISTEALLHGIPAILESNPNV